jgi:hypothetical protein
MDASAAQQQSRVGGRASSSHNPKITLTCKSPSFHKEGVAFENPPFLFPGAQTKWFEQASTNCPNCKYQKLHQGNNKEVWTCYQTS